MTEIAAAPTAIFKGQEIAYLKLGRSVEPIYVRQDGGMFTLSLAIADGWQTLRLGPTGSTENFVGHLDLVNETLNFEFETGD